jgi:thiol-disulfide isomerase/thioredoxin
VEENPMTRRTLTLALLSLSALVLGSVGTAHAGRYNAVASIGDAMPAFTDLPAVDGSTISSSDLDEDVVVLVFLANHCPWVRGMDPDLVALSHEFAGQSVRIVGLAVNHRPEDRLPKMIEHAKEFGYDFTYAYDESQATGRALGATRTPEYFVFDGDRKLVYMGAIHNSPARVRTDGSIAQTNGDPTEFYVHDAIEEVLAGKTVSVAETQAHGCSVEYR